MMVVVVAAAVVLLLLVMPWWVRLVVAAVLRLVVVVVLDSPLHPLVVPGDVLGTVRHENDSLADENGRLVQTHTYICTRTSHTYVSAIIIKRTA